MSTMGLRARSVAAASVLVVAATACCRLYFESNRTAGGYPRDIFVASKVP
jgi:hypothetical protein